MVASGRDGYSPPCAHFLPTTFGNGRSIPVRLPSFVQP